MKEYLPIGSIVLLNGSDKKLMITGYHVEVKEGIKPFDYRGCFYPNGLRFAEEKLVFNHEQISEVLYKGLETEEQKEFLNRLNEAIKKEKGE